MIVVGSSIWGSFGKSHYIIGPDFHMKKIASHFHVHYCSNYWN